MFTDFSKYSRQPKNISSFGAVTINQNITDRSQPPKFPDGSTPATSARIKDANGNWHEISADTQEELDKAMEELCRSVPCDDSATPDKDDPKDPDKPAPRRGDPDWIDPNPYQPPPPPPRKSDQQKRDEKARENQDKTKREADARKAEEKRKAEERKKAGGGGGGGGGGGQQQSQPPPPPPKGDTGSPADFSKTGTGTDASKDGIGAGKPANFTGSSSTGGTNPPTQPPQQASLGGWGSSSSISAGAWGGTTGGNMQLQESPAYYGQSGSNPATYPAQLNSTPITPSGSSPWITDYNSVGFMTSDPIMGGSYSAPSGVNFSNTQGTNPATQVGISYPLQQDVYDTYSNVTGAETNYMGGSPSFNEATGQYTNVTRNPIANPNTLPTMLSEYDLFGNVGASSGLFLDTPTIKQNAVGTTAAVDTAEVAEPAQGGGLGWVTIGLIALKALSVI